MTLNTFTRASKDTFLAALLFFSCISVQESSAASRPNEVVSMVNNPQANTIDLVQQLAKQIALTMRLEDHAKNSAILINAAHAQFEADEISAEDLFMVTVMHHQITESLALAKVEMVIALNQLINEQSRQ